jgi:hypothetical protein
MAQFLRPRDAELRNAELTTMAGRPVPDFPMIEIRKSQEAVKYLESALHVSRA